MRRVVHIALVGCAYLLAGGLSAAHAQTFTNDPITPGVTPIRAVHVAELRVAIDWLRAVAGLPPSAWTDPALTPGVTTVRAAHVAELRARFDEALTRLGYGTLPYTEASLAPAATVVRGVHFTELRARVQGAKVRFLTTLPPITRGPGTPPGRWKWGTGGCYWDASDSGPNQCAPPEPPDDGAPPDPPSGGAQPSILTSGQELSSLKSPDGRFQFAYRSDGDLVLSEGSRVLWHSNTFWRECTQPSWCEGIPGPWTATMQADGNFVLRASNGTPVYWTGTNGYPGAYLRVENDGFVGIYSTSGLMLWSSSVKFAPTPTSAGIIKYGFTWLAPTYYDISTDCFGNCGAGCSDAMNPCGGPEQRWELTLKTEPVLIQTLVEQTVCNAGVYYVRPYEEVQAIGTWTYHGFVKWACKEHDRVCAPEDGLWGALKCVLWIGCLDPLGWYGHTQAWEADAQIMRGFRYTGGWEFGGYCVDPPPPDPMD
jgi:hypothetical protein